MMLKMKMGCMALGMCRNVDRLGPREILFRDVTEKGGETVVIHTAAGLLIHLCARVRLR